MARLQSRLFLARCTVAAIVAVVALAMPAGSAVARFDSVVEVQVGGVTATTDLSALALNAPRIGPVASPEQALQIVAQLRRRYGPNRSIAVEIGPGVFRLDRALAIDARHGGTWSSSLVIKGAANRETVLSGAVVLEPKVTGASYFVRAVPEVVRASARVYQLPARLARERSVGIERFHPIHAAPLPLELFDAEGALRPARWPNDGFVRALPPPDGETGRRVAIAEAPIGLMAGASDAWLNGYLRYDWSYESLPIRPARAGASATTGSDGKLGAVVDLALPPRYGLVAGARVFIEHTPAALDVPGEWVRLDDHQHVVVLPRDSADILGGAVEAAVADTLITVDGASHVHIEGLVLEKSRADALRITNGTNVIFSSGTIRWTGGRGATVDGGATSGLRDSVIVDTGDGGVSLTGGDRRILRPSQNFLVDSVVMRFSRLGRTFKPAAYLNGVGQRVVGNLFADSPHQAIYFQGNDHTIAFNEVTRVVTETSDAGAIYTGRDWTAQGTVLRHNYLHDFGKFAGGPNAFETKGIYVDDLASGITVEENVFRNVQQAVFIGGGRDNRVTRNIFVHASPAIHLDARGLDWMSAGVANPDGELRSQFRAVPVGSAVWRARYRELAGTLDDTPGAPKRNAAHGNLVIGGEAFQFHGPVDREQQNLDAPLEAELPPGTATIRDPLRLARELQRAPGDPLASARLGTLPFAEMDRVRALAPLVVLALPRTAVREHSPGE